MRLTDSGDTAALEAMFRDDSASSGSSGGAVSGGEYGMDDLVMSAGDLGVPEGGTVTLSIEGGDADYEEEVEADADGNVCFHVPRQRVGSTITVSLVVKKASGIIVCSGRKTMLVGAGCQFRVTLTSRSCIIPVTMKSGNDIKDILTGSLGAGSGTLCSFGPSLTPPPAGTTTYSLSEEGSEVELLAWRDGDSIRYYAAGVELDGVIPLPASSKNMFYHCSRLASIDMSGFDASGVTDMQYMFCGCECLTSLNLAGWDTSNVTNITSMFNSCRNLTSLDLSGWNTSNLTELSSVFYLCHGLESVDLTGWDTSNVTTMQSMFDGCGRLTTIYVSASFVTDAVTNAKSYHMFFGCNALYGGAGTAWSDSHTNKSYARIDGGPSAPGYFTAR